MEIFHVWLFLVMGKDLTDVVRVSCQELLFTGCLIKILLFLHPGFVLFLLKKLPLLERLIIMLLLLVFPIPFNCFLGPCIYFFASSQFLPVPTSIAIGISHSTICSMISWSIFVTSSISVSGHSTTSSSWTCMMSLASSFLVSNTVTIFTIACLSISAHVH